MKPDLKDLISQEAGGNCPAGELENGEKRKPINTYYTKNYYALILNNMNALAAHALYDVDGSLNLN